MLKKSQLQPINCIDKLCTETFSLKIVSHVFWIFDNNNANI